MRKEELRPSDEPRGCFAWVAGLFHRFDAGVQTEIEEQMDRKYPVRHLLKKQYEEIQAEAAAKQKILDDQAAARQKEEKAKQQMRDNRRARKQRRRTD